MYDARYPIVKYFSITFLLLYFDPAPPVRVNCVLHKNRREKVLKHDATQLEARGKKRVMNRACNIVTSNISSFHEFFYLVAMFRRAG